MGHPAVEHPAVEHGAFGAVLGLSDALLPSCPSRWLQLPPLLTSSSVALRILAGETIALLFELAQDLEVRHGLWQWEQAAEGELALTTRHPGRGVGPSDPPALSWPWQWSVPGAHPSKSPAFWQEDLCHQDTEFLCTQLKVLATESNKYRAKTDRRRQRSIFRDILRFIEVSEPGATLLCPCVAASQLPDDSSLESQGTHRAGAQVSADAPLSAQSGEYQEETVRFGLECMYLDSWARQRTYQAFKEVLGSGIHHHLQV